MFINILQYKRKFYRNSTITKKKKLKQSIPIKNKIKIVKNQSSLSINPRTIIFSNNRKTDHDFKNIRAEVKIEINFFFFFSYSKTWSIYQHKRKILLNPSPITIFEWWKEQAAPHASRSIITRGSLIGSPKDQPAKGNGDGWLLSTQLVYRRKPL